MMETLGAVVAREFGLPCVVGVEDATVAFNSGNVYYFIC